MDKSQVNQTHSKGIQSCGIYKSHSQSSTYKSKRIKHKHEKMNATFVESINCMYTKVLQWVPIPMGTQYPPIPMGKWVGNGYGLGHMGG